MEDKKPVQTPNPATPSVPPLTPVEPAPKNRKLSFLLVIIPFVLLLIMATSTTAFFIARNLALKTSGKLASIDPSITSSSENSTEWKTYTNTKYGYSVDYPGNWSFREYPDSKSGAGFSPQNSQGGAEGGDWVSISAGMKLGNRIDDPFEEYVKIAGKEIQNYNTLASLNKVITDDGATGYRTTWMVASPIGAASSAPSESSPITYFEMPGSPTMLVRVTLDRDGDLETYEKMLTTVKFASAPKVIQSTPSPAPSVDESAVLKRVIRLAIDAKSNFSGNPLDITVSEIDGNFAKGFVSEDGGGGLWFAAKVNGAWELVWDGNGVILCSDLTSYPDFPVKLIPECYDDKNQNSVKR